MSIRGTLYLTIISLLLFACGGNDDAQGDPQIPQLVFPENNSECLEGVVSPSNPNVAAVEFRWTAADNASGYTLNIVNLETGEGIVESTVGTSLPVDLTRGTPYSWNVVANTSTTSSAPSETWKFYNAGEGVSSYAPFPADLVFPRSGANISVNGSRSVELRWEGSDVDNDIIDYQVLFGTTTPPTENIGGNGPTASLTVTNLSANTTYYWRVITTDESGNSSVSEVSEFFVNN